MIVALCSAIGQGMMSSVAVMMVMMMMAMMLLVLLSSNVVMKGADEGFHFCDLLFLFNHPRCVCL